MTFLVCGRRFGGIRNVLSARSMMFKNMLRGNFKESSSMSPIPLPQYDDAPGAFRLLLVFMHTGSAESNDISELMHLYEMAQYFQIEDLHALCLKALEASRPSKETAALLMKFAQKHEMASAHVCICTGVFCVFGTDI